MAIRGSRAHAMWGHVISQISRSRFQLQSAHSLLMDQPDTSPAQTAKEHRLARAQVVRAKRAAGTLYKLQVCTNAISLELSCQLIGPHDY